MIISQKKKLGFRKDKLQQFYEIEVKSFFNEELLLQ